MSLNDHTVIQKDIFEINYAPKATFQQHQILSYKQNNSLSSIIGKNDMINSKAVSTSVNLSDTK